MTKLFKIISFCILASLLSSCSQVLQTVDLKINAEDNSLQEKFNVVEKTLTISEAKAQKNAVYSRAVLKGGRGDNAKPIPEKLALRSEFPKNEAPYEYRIGIGDTIAFSRLIENDQPSDKTVSQWPKSPSKYFYTLGIGDTLSLIIIKQVDTDSQLASSLSSEDLNGASTSSKKQADQTISSRGRIGSDGSVLLLEVGRLEATGKSLNELRSEVRNILIRNGISPRFQLEIVEFKSQKYYLTINASFKTGSPQVIINASSQVRFLDSKIKTIRDVLTSANIGVKPGVITHVRLQRDGKEFSMSLRELYSENKNNLNVQPDDHIFVEDRSDDIKTTSSTVDHEGKVVFENVGKLKAAGHTLRELRVKIKNLLHVVPDSQNAFQIQITDFVSQKALLSMQKTEESASDPVIPITDIPLKLAEALIKRGLSNDNNSITQINLHRNGKTYSFTLDSLLHLNAPTIYIQPEDRIVTSVLPYKENKVFILGGVSPKIYKINPQNRETLADVLFTSGGALSTSSAKRSEVYLLRGNNPVVAYHLNAQSPTTLIVADTMELRPNDILYVAEQPITSFNRTLGTIIPLRMLLRDIQDNNIP